LNSHLDNLISVISTSEDWNDQSEHSSQLVRVEISKLLDCIFSEKQSKTNLECRSNQQVYGSYNRSSEDQAIYIPASREGDIIDRWRRDVKDRLTHFDESIYSEFQSTIYTSDKLGELIPR
jgi:hypothetical protein